MHHYNCMYVCMHACMHVCNTFAHQIKGSKLGYITDVPQLAVVQDIHTIPTGICLQQQQKTHQQPWNVIITLYVHCIFGFTMYFWIYFCNHIVLMNYVAYRILFLASQMRIYSVPVTWNLVWHGLIKSHFIWGHNFAWTHLNRTKCLNVTISNQPMWIEPNSSLLMCATACKLI